jgi:hypothetical protein
LTQISPRPGDGPVLRAEHRRPELGDPTERLARLVPVAQFLGDHPDVVRDRHHQRIGVTEPPLPRRVGLLEHPARRRRIVRPLMNPRQLVGGLQHVRMVVGQIHPPQLHGTLEDSTRPGQIAGVGEGLRALPGRTERGRLRHNGNAARYAPMTPDWAGMGGCMPWNVRRPTLPAGATPGRVKFPPVRLAGPPIPTARRGIGLVRLCRASPGGGMADALA